MFCLTSFWRYVLLFQMKFFTQKPQYITTHFNLSDFLSNRYSFNIIRIEQCNKHLIKCLCMLIDDWVIWLIIFIHTESGDLQATEFVESQYSNIQSWGGACSHVRTREFWPMRAMNNKNLPIITRKILKGSFIRLSLREAHKEMEMGFLDCIYNILKDISNHLSKTTNLSLHLAIYWLVLLLWR